MISGVMAQKHCLKYLAKDTNRENKGRIQIYKREQEQTSGTKVKHTPFLNHQDQSQRE